MEMKERMARINTEISRLQFEKQTLRCTIESYEELMSDDCERDV